MSVFPPTAYAIDRQFTDRFARAVCDIVGPRLLTPSTIEVDCREATDFVLVAKDMKISARVRRIVPYLKKFSNQFTIRSWRDSGATTELTKIIDGWGNWLFYGFADEPDDFRLWHIINLDVFRASLIRNNQLASLGRQVPNGDGTYFVPFTYDEFPPELIIDKWAPHV